MWDLINVVIPKVKADWKHLAYSLEYDIPTVKAIQKDSHDTGDCCENLFEDWLSTDHGAAPKTWCTLIKRIEQVESLFAAAAEIKKELSRKLTSTQ